MSKKSRRELAVWVWIVLAVLLAMCVPETVPTGGMVAPLVWAFPHWGWLRVGSDLLLGLVSIALCASKRSRGKGLRPAWGILAHAAP